MTMLPRETSGSFDQVSMSDGSQLEFDKILDLMQMIIREKHDMADQLKQAHQKIQELTEETYNLRNIMGELTRRWQQTSREKRDLTHQLEQALQERDDLAHQLKEARLEGEASSQPIHLEELTRQSIRKWFVRECQN